MTTIGHILNAIFGQPKRGKAPDKLEAPRQRTADVSPHERARLEQIKKRADRRRKSY